MPKNPRIQVSVGNQPIRLEGFPKTDLLAIYPPAQAHFRQHPRATAYAFPAGSADPDAVDLILEVLTASLRTGRAQVPQPSTLDEALRVHRAAGFLRRPDLAAHCDAYIEHAITHGALLGRAELDVFCECVAPGDPLFTCLAEVYARASRADWVGAEVGADVLEAMELLDEYLALKKEALKDPRIRARRAPERMQGIPLYGVNRPIRLDKRGRRHFTGHRKVEGEN